MYRQKAGELSFATGNLDLPLLLKVPQAAKLLGLSVSSIDRLVGRGELKAVVKLRHRLIPRSEIDRFMSSAIRVGKKGGE